MIELIEQIFGINVSFLIENITIIVSLSTLLLGGFSFILSTLKKEYIARFFCIPSQFIHYSLKNEAYQFFENFFGLLLTFFAFVLLIQPYETNDIDRNMKIIGLAGLLIFLSFSKLENGLIRRIFRIKPKIESWIYFISFLMSI